MRSPPSRVRVALANGPCFVLNHLTSRISPRPFRYCVPRLLAMLLLASRGQFNIKDDVYLLYDISSCAST